jgi:hypothetical protein
VCSQIFLSWTLQTTRVLCSWIKTLLVVAYSLKPLVIYIVLLIVSLVQLWT